MTDGSSSSPQSPLLSMRGVQKRFGPTIALKGVDLDVYAGQALSLIGENGAGKSTLMKTLSGAHAADSGTMTLDGRPYHPRGPLDARRAGVAMIYQELSIAPDLTVMENVLLGVEPGPGPLIGWGEMRRRAAAALREVGRPDIDPAARAGSLGIAEQQLVEIARSVALGCRVLVLDEPTSSLTARDIDNLFAMLRRLKGRGIGIVYISHFLEEVRAISERFVVLRDGASVGGGVTSEVRDDQIIRLMVGRDVEDLYPRTTHAPGECVLELSGLGGIKRPRSASLELRRGEVLGIAGLVGAGRTEMLRAIFGLDRVTRGDVRVAAYRGPAAPGRRWGQGVGMVSEDRKTEGLALGLSIADNVTLSRMSGLGPLGLVLPGRQERATWPWLHKLAVKCRSPRQPVGDLSGGNQQKVALARLLHHDVDVLLLDEPTRGVDIGAKARIYQLIDELANGEGGRKPCAVLVVSSYLPELLGICDHIAVMNRGVLGPVRRVAEWDEHTLMAEAIRTEAADPAPSPAVGAGSGLAG
ncbi:MAG TPA: sugar ABC transporter ATP-binding protein [Tepidisphaeraceae bacterium]|jgi:ribose transport system ATP-binding protein